MIEDIIFNENLYLKIRNERKRLGLPLFEDIYPENGRIFNHELEGKKLLKNKKTEYTIQSVHKHWHHGWYYILLVYRLCESHCEELTTDIIGNKTYGRSHGVVYWENISCVNDVIVNGITEDRKKYKLI